MKKWIGLCCVLLAFSLCSVTAAAGSSVNEMAAVASKTESGDEKDSKITEEERETAQKVIAFVKEKLDNGEMETEDDIRDAIAEAEQEFNVELSEDTKDKIVQVAKKVQDLGLDTDELAKQAQSLYEKYGNDIFEKAADDIVETVKEAVAESVKTSMGNFFTDFGNNIKEFFGSLFS